MAERRAIREAVYGELEASIADVSVVDASDISQQLPERREDFPAIIHTDRYRSVPMNDASDGPHSVVRDATGHVEALSFESVMEAVFDVTVLHDDEQAKEDIYEALRRHFERYEYGFWDVSDIHDDAYSMDVRDSVSVDDSDREPVVRGDRIDIYLGFTRTYRAVREDAIDQYGEYDGTFADTIKRVDHAIDVAQDGVVDETYTTTEA